MRKFIVWLMIFSLAVVTCSYAAEKSTADVGDVSVFTRYDAYANFTNGVTDYSGTDGYHENGTFFGARLKGSYNSDMVIPYGTLFYYGAQTPLIGNIDNNSVIVYIGSGDMTGNEALNVRWSINTQPLTIGSMTLPKEFLSPVPDTDSEGENTEGENAAQDGDEDNTPTYDKAISGNIPYVRLLHDDGDSNITRIMICFVTSGDSTFSPKSASGASSVRVNVYKNDNTLLKSEEYTDYGRGVPVIHNMSVKDLGLSNGSNFNVQVVYDDSDNNLYFWQFIHNRGNDRPTIEWKKIDEETASNVDDEDEDDDGNNSQNDNDKYIWPGNWIEIHSEDIDTEQSIDISVPVGVTVNKFYAFSTDIAELTYTTEGSEMNGSVIHAKLTGKKYGYTTVRLEYSLYGQDYTDMRVVAVQEKQEAEGSQGGDGDGDGSGGGTSGDGTSDNGEDDENWYVPDDWTGLTSPLKFMMADKGYRISVSYIENGLSLDANIEDSHDAEVPIGLSMDIQGSDASYYDADAVMGFRNNIYLLKYEGDGKFSIAGNDMFYIDGAWIESSKFPELNGIISNNEEDGGNNNSDGISKAADNEDSTGSFAPNIELVRDGRSVNSIKWSIASSGSDSVNSMSNLHVWYSFGGTLGECVSKDTATASSASGTFELEDATDYNQVQVYFSYIETSTQQSDSSTCSTEYIWCFNQPDMTYSNDQQVYEGYSIDITLDTSVSSNGSTTSSTGYDFEIYSGSIDIVSAEIVEDSDSSTKDDNSVYTFRIIGKKAGYSTITIVATPKASTNGDDNSGDDNNNQSQPTVRAWSYLVNVNPTLEAEFGIFEPGIVLQYGAQLIEGKNGGVDKTQKTPEIYLTGTGVISVDVGEEDNNENLTIYYTVTLTPADNNEQGSSTQAGENAITTSGSFDARYMYKTDSTAWVYIHGFNECIYSESNNEGSGGDGSTGTVDGEQTSIKGAQVTWTFTTTAQNTGNGTVGESAANNEEKETDEKDAGKILTGEAKIPSTFTTDTASIDLILSGTNATGANWLYTGASLPTDSYIFCEYAWESYDVSSNSNSVTFDNPMPLSMFGNIYLYAPIKTTDTKDTGSTSNIMYRWCFGSSSYYVEPGTTITWTTDSPDYPIVMKAGDTLDVTVTITGQDSNNSFYIMTGSTDILSGEIKSESKGEVTITLTAKSSGVATFTLVLSDSGTAWTSPREVWVYDDDGMVSGLSSTQTVTEILAMLAEGYGTGSSSGGSTYGRATASGAVIANSDAITFSGDNAALNSYDLSVKPKFAVPQDPSEQAYLSMWDYTSQIGDDEVLIIEDDNLVASRDVEEVFDAVKAALIKQDTPQLLAIVLPEIAITEDGYYTFAISVDNIPADTAIFWYSNPPAAVTNVAALPYSFTDNELTDEEAASLDKTRQIFMKADGTLTDVVSTDDNGTLNVSVYLEAGKSYEPIITAEATELDVLLIGENIDPIVIKNESLKDGTVGTEYSEQLEANYDDVKWSADTLPAGLELSESTGKISGTPEASGDFEVTVTATRTMSAKATLAININAAAEEPEEEKPEEPTEEGPLVVPDPGEEIIVPEEPVVPVVPVIEEPVVIVIPEEPEIVIVEPIVIEEPESTEPAVNTDELEVISVMPEAPRIDVQAMVSTIREILQSVSTALKSLITDDTEVLELPSEASGSERTLDDVPEEELARIPSTQKPAAVLPVMTVTKPAVYVFGLTLDNLKPGAYIYLHMMASPVGTTGRLNAADTDSPDDAYVFLDDDGEVTEVVPPNQHVNVAAYMSPEYSYAPIVTTSDTPEVTPVTEPEDEPDATGPGESTGSGGCNTGVSLSVLAVLAMALKRRK